ncbi:unnamed protein product [Allacma fusca]|nr:unnamed protein product [Allacma fusca]
MEKSSAARSSGPRWSPDIVQLESGRRLKPLGPMNKHDSLASGNHRFSSKSILPLGKKDRLSNTKEKEEPRISPPANFNDYTYRRSRRIYNKTVNDYPVKVLYVNKEDDPMMRLRNVSTFRWDKTDSKEMYLACLGLQRNSASNNCDSHRYPSNGQVVSVGREELMSCKFREKEIPFEELLSEGYMIYPHDLLSTASSDFSGSQNCQQLPEDSNKITDETCTTKSTKVVKTNSGKLRGILEISRNGGRYHAFLGVPFADPPNRFEVAKPVTPWQDVRSAMNYGSICPQIDPIRDGLGNVIGDENCLYLNIFTPEEGRCQSEKLPVLFNIHGGSFLMKSGDSIHPKFFMDDCIVYVSTNYRLGALGFLTTGDEVIPGNLGMKDALLALKWTHDNIQFFQGNEEEVTLIGISAGAAFVTHFMASPAARGLFHRVIAQSGSALAPWAVGKCPQENARYLGQQFGCSETSSSKLKECLSKINVADLVKNQFFNKDWIMAAVNFDPVVEPADATEPFQTEDPYIRFKRGDSARVPLLTGVMKDEGISIRGYSILSTKAVLDDLNYNWHQAAPFLFMFSHLNISEEKRNSISDSIREFYFQNKKIGPETKQAVYDSMSDLLFGTPVFEHSSFHSKYAPVYHYVMTFQGNFSTFQRASEMSELVVTHGDDEPYLFKLHPSSPEPENDSDRLRFSQKLVKLWTSFVKTGKPTDLWSYVTTWDTFTVEEPSTLNLNTHTEKLIKFRNERMTFWQNLKLRELEFPQEFQ